MDGGRDSITVLVSIEPRSYREVIGAALQALRPRVDVKIVDPEALRPQVLDLVPELVIADIPNTFTPDSSSAWMEYRPYSEEPAKVCAGGHERKVQEVDLDVLLAIVDEVEAAGNLEGGC